MIIEIYLTQLCLLNSYAKMMVDDNNNARLSALFTSKVLAL